MIRLLRYLFPPLHPRQRIPLLPRTWSSEHTNQQVHDGEAILLLKVHGLARTDADAMRILHRHRGEAINDIVTQLKRKRRREPRLAKAWRRFKAIW